jgi:hypothetical protein
MSEEFCDGVKILLKRMESNPEEFKNTDKWEELASTRVLGSGFWAHALEPEEVAALIKGMRKIHREVFTNRVMAKLLEDKEEKTEAPYPSGGYFMSGGGGGGGGVLGQGKIVTLPISNPYQNIAMTTSDTSIYPTLSPFAVSEPTKPKSFWGSFLKGMAGR